MGNELIFSGQNLTRIPVWKNQNNEWNYNSITYMDLSCNQISNLNGLNNLPNLETLILDCNYIRDVCDIPLYPYLTTLSLNKNKVTDLDLLLDTLKRKTKSLRFLSLLGNSCCPNQLSGPDFDDNDYNRYRCYVIFTLPTLKFLDSTPVTKAEREEAALRGRFLKVIKPALCPNDLESDKERKKFLPLPPAKSVLTHKGIYGACRYRYTGKNSEGNRFIRNHDL